MVTRLVQIVLLRCSLTIVPPTGLGVNSVRSVLDCKESRQSNRSDSLSLSPPQERNHWAGVRHGWGMASANGVERLRSRQWLRRRTIGRFGEGGGGRFHLLQQ
jgi:hypothetical protein